jgi:hypothetical protein
MISRACALAVAEVLRPAIGDVGRIECSGAGASSPRRWLAHTPEKRVRNFTVELIL